MACAQCTQTSCAAACGSVINWLAVCEVRMLHLHTPQLFNRLKMPIVYCRKICPGNAGRKCRWSTELQKRPALIRDDALSCQICIAVGGLSGWDAAQLALHLAHLYELDPDLFACARTQLPAVAFDSVSAKILNMITSHTPRLKRGREDQRKMILARTLKYLTTTSWVLDCWLRRTKEDTADVVHADLAMYTKLPYTARGLVLDFLCGDLEALYSHLCTLKTKAYHTLERPLFWLPQADFAEAPTTKPSARQILVGVYSHVLDQYHKPKLSKVKSALVKHNNFVKRNRSMRGRVKNCNRIFQILDVMLSHDVVALEGPPFEPVMRQ